MRVFKPGDLIHFHDTQYGNSGGYFLVFENLDKDGWYVARVIDLFERHATTLSYTSAEEYLRVTIASVSHIDD